MSETYPIVSQSYLDPAPGRGLLRLGKKARRAKDLPRPHAHQVLVFRVDGRYLADNGKLPLDDDQVVRASHVSLVDVGADVPVTVRVSIPSAEASDFVLHIAFTCTVIDPVRVVRENVNAQTAINTYLRKDQKLFQLGLSYGMTDINQMRVEVGARLRAYTEVKRPEAPGLRLAFASVEVLTPGELAAFEKARREKLRAHLLASEEQGYHQELAVGRDRHSQELTDLQRRYRHMAEIEDREHDRILSRQDQRHRQLLQAEEAEFAHRQVELAVEAIGGDPYRALLWAHTHGALDARELADRIAADRQRQAELRRTEEQQQLEWAREDQLQDREDRRRREQESREDKLRREQGDRDERQRQQAIKAEVLSDVMKRGHGDFVNIRPERLIADVTGIPHSELTAGPGTRREELPASDEPAAIGSKGSSASGYRARRGNDDPPGDAPVDRDDVDLEVREEDD